MTTFRHPKTGVEREVGPDERVKRQVLERAGFREAGGEQDRQPDETGAFASQVGTPTTNQRTRTQTATFPLGDGATLSADVTVESEEDEAIEVPPTVPTESQPEAKNVETPGDMVEEAHEQMREPSDAPTAFEKSTGKKSRR